MDAIRKKFERARIERERRFEQVSDGARTDHQLKAPSGSPVVLRSRVVSLAEAQRERERILEAGAPGTAGAAHKMLRTQVFRRLSQIDANTLAILSASNGEGKTLTAINLAIAVAAHAGHTALLIDLDLRNPSIARRFGFQPKVGVEDCLQNRASLHEAITRISGYERLAVLPARARVEHSSELLATQRTADLILELRSRYRNRLLIFDLPPVLLADDALVLSAQVDAGLLVVAEGKTARDNLTRTLALLQELPIVGTVLNASRDSAGPYY